MAAEPQDMFAQAQTALTVLGLSDQQLNSIKFTGKHRHRPMDEWVLTWDPHIPIVSNPQIPSLMRQYAILKFALVDGPAENSPDVPQAFRLISEDIIAGLAADQLAYCNRQRTTARKPRGHIKEIGMTMHEFVEKYALVGENRLLAAKELWLGFGQYFRWKARLDMTLKGDSYVYLDDNTLAYVTFRNYVRDARKSTSH
jgi:hypothetical protein